METRTIRDEEVGAYDPLDMHIERLADLDERGKLSKEEIQRISKGDLFLSSGTVYLAGSTRHSRRPTMRTRRSFDYIGYGTEFDLRGFRQLNWFNIADDLREMLQRYGLSNLRGGEMVENLEEGRLVAVAKSRYKVYERRLNKAQ